MVTTLEYKKMSSSLSKATSDNLKIRNVHTNFFFVLRSTLCVRYSAKHFLSFVLFPSILRSFSLIVVVVDFSLFVSHSLAPLLTDLVPSFSLTRSFACSCSILSLLRSHSLCAYIYIFLSFCPNFFPFVLMYFLQCM